MAHVCGADGGAGQYGAIRFHKKYLNLRSEDKQSSYGLGTTH